MTPVIILGVILMVVSLCIMEEGGRKSCEDRRTGNAG